MSTISLPERFDFSFHQQFTDNFSTVLDDTSSGTLISIDFSSVLYLDSAALGMLVLANKRATAKGCSLQITNARGAALDVLTIANFERLITIKS